ncbi:adenylyl cyclase-associated protein 2 [Polypterus senegalus]|uniref:adenylyl cyclase-associated protein 2 n=1 Tax=Polypterus senegalus TaxID=55291 RepID=UPI001966BE70|nr:adenylyl cyclase-associated protein 2 [Polypterus senegalus]
MAEIQRLVERLEDAVTRLESLSSRLHGPSGAGGDLENAVNGGLAPSVEAFNQLLSSSVAAYLKNSTDIGEDVHKHAEMVNAAFQAQRSFLNLASLHQQPSEADMATLLQPISEKIQEIQDFRERNRGSKMFNHLSAVSESIPALGWIAVTPKPGPYVKEMNDAAMFYTNRVLKDYKDSDVRHVEWVRSYLRIWTELQAYIKEHHTTGLVWSKNGPAASGVSLSASLAPLPCPPPPPPPGPPPVFQEVSKSDSTALRSALFAELNQGEAITKGLRHVSDDKKTHKNPGLRSQGGVSRQSPTKSQTSSSSGPKAALQNKLPVLELEGKKWRVEYQDNANDLVISEAELKQVVYVFKCSHSTLQIKGKVNSIIVDNCKKLAMVFDNVVGIVEIINSRDIQIQVMGKVPTISINKTEGCHLYLSEESLKCEIVSAKSSEMNILIPKDGDYKEFPVPEQYKTVWDGSRLVTEPTEIAG